jgi:inhibitor of KinA sporulation pathway (predicted exonuclease)
MLDDAFDILRAEYDSEELTWASYGNYDLNMLQNQARRFYVDYPLSDDHINVKNLIRRNSSYNKKECRHAKSLERTWI